MKIVFGTVDSDNPESVTLISGDTVALAPSGTYYEDTKGAIEITIPTQLLPPLQTVACATLSLVLKPTGGEYLDVCRNGEWTCLCGNTPHHEGFHPCDIQGKYIEEDRFDLFRCDRCSRVIDAQSHPKVLFVADPQLLAESIIESHTVRVPEEGIQWPYKGE